MNSNDVRGLDGMSIYYIHSWRLARQTRTIQNIANFDADIVTSHCKQMLCVFIVGYLKYEHTHIYISLRRLYLELSRKTVLNWLVSFIIIFFLK